MRRFPKAIAVVATLASCPALSQGRTPLELPLPDGARSALEQTLAYLGESEAKSMAEGATGIVVGSSNTITPAFGDVPSRTGFAIVRIHDPRYCEGTRCLTLVGNMTTDRMEVCAALAADPELQVTGQQENVLGATGNGFALGQGAGRVLVVMRPGLCVVIPAASPGPSQQGAAQGQEQGQGQVPAAPIEPDARGESAVGDGRTQ